MYMAEVTLTAAARDNLLSLQNTASLIGKTQRRLATGLKVQDATDNAGKYFASKGLTDRAADFRTAKDSIDQGLNTVNAAIKGLEAAIAIVEQMKGLANKALATTDTTAITSYQTQYAALITQLNTLVADVSYGGKNLINGTTASVGVNFNETSANELTITGTSNNNTGLSIAAPLGTGSTWASGSTYIDAAVTAVSAALVTLRSNTETLGSNAALLQIRSQFTSNYINTLESGAGALTLADTNEEGANLTALQTRQQLGVVSLSIASQSEQSILRLF
jgi:flagellin-like hook-associated protein FlgL